MGTDLHFKVPDVISKHANFFRIHLTFFTLTPILFACIFYGGNGTAGGDAEGGKGIEKVTFIDSLFLCYSAMTWVCSLGTLK
jgi:hypothetical protein